MRTALLPAFLLAACAAQEAAPPGPAPTSVPEAQRRHFDLGTEVATATRACIAAELAGPTALRRLEDQGYVYISAGLSGPWETGYAVQSPVLNRLGGTDLLVVNKKRDALPCTIRVFRDVGRTALTQSAETLEAEGYRRVAVDNAERFVGAGGRFTLDSSYVSTSPLATIEIQRLTDDRLCRASDVAASARAGCPAP